MTLLPPGVKVHLAFGYIDMRNCTTSRCLKKYYLSGNWTRKAEMTCRGGRTAHCGLACGAGLKNEGRAETWRLEVEPDL
jgi:hypothetical protein